MSGWTDGNQMLGAPPTKPRRLTLNYVLAGIAWCVLAVAAYAVYWTLGRYVREETTISEYVRMSARAATKERVAAVGVYVGIGIGTVVGMFVSHFLGWT